jgi:pimeloyl-ACP methyl ester carboxylesterase
MLAIRGENSKLLSDATLMEMARRHPDCEVLTIAGQGHAPMLETGDLPERIAAFFEKADLKDKAPSRRQSEAVMPPST